MNFKHTFKANLTWENKVPNQDETIKRYQKSHRISIQGKENLHVSAAKAFKGDPSLHNPEDLLLASLMSCHMMSYLYICSLHSIELISYEDQAEAILQTQMDGSGQIIEIHLNPIIQLRDSSQKELALALHRDANKLCFIANSCNFPVYHHPKVLP